MLGNILMDAYERKARFYPAILAVAPFAAGGFALLAPDLKLVESIGTLALTGGGAFLVCNLSRDRGDRIQQQLFKDWGGMPSVAIMRHQDKRVDAVTKGRYHKALAKMVQGTKAPTPAQEAANPDAADAVYVAWSNYLRVKTRNSPKFALIAFENINFGYRKNVLGLRPFGILLAVLTLLGVGAIALNKGADGPLQYEVVAIAALVLDCVFWIAGVTPKWVKQAGDAYAGRLFEAVEILKK